jgi:ribosomal protein S18 acetylase RimI-like enzyme
MVVIRPYSEADFDVLAARWHETNLASYWYVAEHQRHSLEQAREFFVTHVLRDCEVFVAERAGVLLLGLIAVAPGWVRQLAVFPGHQRQGIGTQLLEKARELSPGGLRLHTFQQNAAARAFYEKHGFRAVAFGMAREPENCPDVEYCWPANAASQQD